MFASYNWGPTRDYVFRIFAAAFIREDPELFGFGIEKSLPDPAP